MVKIFIYYEAHNQQLNITDTCYHLCGCMSSVAPFVSITETVSPLPSFSLLSLSLSAQKSKKLASPTTQSVVFLFNHVSIRHNTLLSQYSCCPLTRAECSYIFCLEESLHSTWWLREKRVCISIFSPSCCSSPGLQHGFLVSFSSVPLESPSDMQQVIPSAGRPSRASKQLSVVCWLLCPFTYTL